MHRPTHDDGTPFDILVLTPDEAQERARRAAEEYRDALRDAQLLAEDDGLEQFAARVRFERELVDRRFNPDDAHTTREIAATAFGDQQAA